MSVMDDLVRGVGSTEETPYGEKLILRLEAGETVRVDTGSFPVRDAPTEG